MVLYDVYNNQADGNGDFLGQLHAADEIDAQWKANDRISVPDGNFYPMLCDVPIHHFTESSEEAVHNHISSSLSFEALSPYDDGEPRGWCVWLWRNDAAWMELNDAMVARGHEPSTKEALGDADNYDITHIPHAQWLTQGDPNVQEDRDWEEECQINEGILEDIVIGNGDFFPMYGDYKFGQISSIDADEARDSIDLTIVECQHESEHIHTRKEEVA